MVPEIGAEGSVISQRFLIFVSSPLSPMLYFLFFRVFGLISPHGIFYGAPSRLPFLCVCLGVSSILWKSSR